MANIVPKLDPSQAYMYCPLCDDMQHIESPLRRSGEDLLKCGLGHQFHYRDLQRLQQQGKKIKMIPTEVIEVPPDHCQKFGVFVHPERWASLQVKLKGRFHATLGTLLDALDDDALMIISGEDAQKLKRRGLNTSSQILAMAEGYHQMELEKDDLLKKLQLLQPILAAAGVSTV